MEQAEIDFKIRVRFLVSINRQAGVEAAYRTLNLIQQVQSKYICGIELSGDPRQGNFNEFIPVFHQARQQGLKISLHCAETEEQASEAQSMIDFKPDRFGHCCYLTKE